MEDNIHDDDTNVIGSGSDIRVDDLLKASEQMKQSLSEEEDKVYERTPAEKIRARMKQPIRQPLPQTKEEKLDAATKDVRINLDGQDLSAEQILLAAAALQQEMARKAQGSRLDLNAAAQVMNIKNLKTKDGKLNFEDMTEEAAYDLDLPIVAKPFSNEDSLDVDLKDKSYVPRWVNVNPLRLGSMRSKGFLFVGADDLASPLNIEIEVDAQGHYRCNDVVLMRITKDRYYSALRAAHLRAIAAVSATGAHKAATGVANQFMEKEAGGEYVDYANKGKVRFYTTGG